MNLFPINLDIQLILVSAPGQELNLPLSYSQWISMHVK